MLFLFLVVEIVALVVEHLYGLESVSDLRVHVVDVADNLELEFSLVGVFGLH